MKMNLLMITVAVLFLIFMLRGYRKGFVKSLASIVSLAASLILVSFIAPSMADYIHNRTPIYTRIRAKCEDSFRIEVEKNASSVSGADKGVSAFTTENNTVEKYVQDGIIDSLNLPLPVRNLLKNNNNASSYKKVAAGSFNEYVPNFIADLIVNIIAFIITWVIAAVIILVMTYTLDAIASLPVLCSINRILGVGLGFVHALTLVWLGFLVITIFADTQVGKELLGMISENMLLRRIYDANLFLHFLQGLVRSV